MFTKDFVVPFVVGCEMLDVTVKPQEARSSSRTSQAKLRPGDVPNLQEQGRGSRLATVYPGTLWPVGTL